MPDELAGRIPIVRAAAEGPVGRCRRSRRGWPSRPNEPRELATRSAAIPRQCCREIRAFESLGVEHLALVFEATEPAKLAAALERFDAEVVKASAEA